MEISLDWEWVPIPEEGARGVQEVDFGKLLVPPLKVYQDNGAAGCGGKLWPAGDLLGRYLIRKQNFPFKKVLELGSGTGLAGLALAKAHPTTEVYVTDQQEMLPLMQQNIVLNNLEGRAHAELLNWGEPLPDFCKGVDLVLAADCVYLESAFPLLEKTLKDLTEGGEVYVLMAYKRRRKADRHFFRAMRKSFTITELSDFPEFEEFHRESVFLFKMERKV